MKMKLLQVLVRQNYMDKKEYDDLTQKVNEIERILFAILKSCERVKV